MDVDSIKTVLSGICIAAGGLSVVMVAVSRASSEWSESQQNGVNESRMMRWVIAAVCWFAAAALVAFVELDIEL